MGSVIRPSKLGRVITSPKAMKLIEESDNTIGEVIERHRKGDYGNITIEDLAMNESSIIDGEGIITSIYNFDTEAVIVRSYLSPFKGESFTEITTGWEL